MNFGERLKRLRSERELTQKELSERLNVSQVTLRNWEKGIKSPSMEAIISISRVLDVSSDFLLDTHQVRNTRLSINNSERRLIEDYRTLDDYGKNVVDKICSLELDRVKDNLLSVCSTERYIPIYANPAAAGHSSCLDGEDFEMMLVTDSTPTNADFAVRIQGSSMSPFILDGQTVFVKKTQEIENGDIGIFCVDGSMYCKQYLRKPSGDIELLSLNPELKNLNIQLPSDSGRSINVYGKVLMNKRVKFPSYI